MQTHSEQGSYLHLESTAQDITTEPETFSPVQESISIAPGKSRPKNLTPERILSLQRTIGNQAVMRILREQGSLPIARVTAVSDSEESSPSEEEAEEPGVENEQQEAEEPGVEDEQQEAQAEAEQIAPEVEFVKGKPALAEFVTEQMVEGPGSEKTEVAKPGLWKRVKSGASSAASGAKRIAKRMKKPISGAYTGIKLTGKTVTGVGHGLSYATSVSESLAGLGASVATAAPGLGVAAGGIDMAAGGYSLASSANKSRKLRGLAAQEQAAVDGNSLMAEALNYAATQKKQKAVKKGIGLVATGATVAGSIVGLVTMAGILATNPIGWALLVAGGTIGIGMLAYRIKRHLRQKSGELRKEMAGRLHKGVLEGNPRAIKAVQELGLDLNMVKQVGHEELDRMGKMVIKGGGEVLIANKIKTV